MCANISGRTTLRNPVFDDGGLFNLLLLKQSPDDFYGTWIVCEVSKSPTVSEAFPLGPPRTVTDSGSTKA